jgi:hypothetical protein
MKQLKMNKEALNDELNPLSPTLRDLKQQDDGFRLPEGYFEAMEAAVLSRVEASDTRRKPVLAGRKGGLWGRLLHPKAMWAAAAALALMLAATLFLRSPNATTTNSDWASEELTEEDIEAFLLDNISDFETEQLFTLTTSATLSSSQPNATIPDNNLLIEDLSTEEIELMLKELSPEELETLLKT